MCFGPEPDRDAEIEQQLTITSAGEVCCLRSFAPIWMTDVGTWEMEVPIDNLFVFGDTYQLKEWNLSE